MAIISESAAIQAHYDREHLTARILTALRQAGIDIDHLTPGDLAQIDQFHMGGIRTTLELLALAGIDSGARVLDAGGGIGGPARTIAQSAGCCVTVLDLSESFCEAGERLTELTKQTEMVDFVHANALEIPFDNASFDVVWTQHSSMNIDDKEGLYREFNRVLEPRGQLAIHEVFAGSVEPVVFPVPWAQTPETSFLRPSEAMRKVIADAGFLEVEWKDVSANAIAFWRKQMAALAFQDAKPALGLHILQGEAFAEAARGAALNLEEDRIRVVQAIFSKR